MMQSFAALLTDLYRGPYDSELLSVLSAMLELGFSPREVERLRAGGAIPGAPEREAA